MIRWKIVALGAVVFLAAHWVEVAHWRDWFLPGGEFPPWFLNSARSVMWTTMFVVAAGVVVGAFSSGRWRESLIAGSNLTIGAVIAMTIVLFVSGPGTIFPIALAIGGGLLAIAGFGGVLVSAGMGGRIRKSLNR